jgi:transcriptional regulator with XRE-family HTH domain
VQKTKPIWEGTPTRLEKFVRAWGVPYSTFAERAGISYTHLLRLRRGELDPGRKVMIALADTASAMLGRPVCIVELFELGPADEAIYEAMKRKPE